jgi:sporulation protein YlmC with PRC-barrel domain
MNLKVATAAAVIGVLVSSAALAQTSSPNASPRTSTDSTQTASVKGEWQASKLIHMNVYNNQNEKIGDIKELMLDKTGKIDTVAIGVGGFLGMGERDVAVKFGDLKWSDEPVRSTTSSNPPATTSGSGQTQESRGRNYPDHAVLNATKDQLKSMPQFDYNK